MGGGWGGGWEVGGVGDGWCGGWEVRGAVGGRWEVRWVGDGRCGGWDNTHRTAVSASISVEGPLSAVRAPICQLGDDSNEGGVKRVELHCTGFLIP